MVARAGLAAAAPFWRASRRPGWLVPLGLAGAVLAVFVQTVAFDFVNFDDPLFVQRNPFVQGGLTLDGWRWAWSFSEASQFHPLTWLSYMLDREVLGPGPAGFHAVNVLLHLVATLLLFAVLRTATGSVWRSALVALLWAVHPLRAESVAWVAERKDVLSACLGLGCLWCYVAWTRRPGTARYLAVTSLLLLGLLAKPMLVTLPVIMAVMDVWPLGRTRLCSGLSHSGHGEQTTWRRLVVEKLPWLALALVAGLVTVAQQAHASALRSTLAYPMDVRLGHAVTSVWWYVARLAVPARLAVFYPFDRVPGVGEAVAAALGLAAVSVLAALALRRYPWVATGWASFLVMLLPVIGIVQVGSQRVADRYSYLPHIGLLVAVVWMAAELLVTAPRPARVVAAGGVVLLVAVMAWLGARQVAVFATSEILFRHALQVTENNYLAHTNLAAALAQDGRLEEASLHYRAALRILPQWEVPRFGLAEALERQGQLAEAARQYGVGLGSRPDDPRARKQLGRVLLLLGRHDDAVTQLRTAVRLEPRDPEAAALLARALGQ